MSFLWRTTAGRVALLVAAAGLVWLLIRFFDSNRGLQAKHDDLIAWARDGSPSAFAKDFAGPGYHDQWGFTPAAAGSALRAVRLTHPGITITEGPRATVRDGDTAIITQRITVTGAGERREAEFRFTWHKEGFWPGSWRLQEVTAPGVP